jgi:hypothetical protein
MDDLIYKIKPIVPGPLWKAITTPYWRWYNRARHQVAARYDSRLAHSQDQVRQLRDLHKGERCFIIGNGPSLNETDLSLLKNEITFGMNRIYLLFPEIGYETSYFVSINTLVLEQCAGDIRSLGMPRFITWRGRHWFGDEVYFLDTDYTPPANFTGDITGRIFEGSTVTYVAMQIAYYLGFQEVILIGVDHNFSIRGDPNETIVSDGRDLNHFSPDYFGKGFRWQLPDLEASELAYRLAKEAYESNGRRIVDATIGGKLDIFPKTDYQSLFP